MHWWVTHGGAQEVVAYQKVAGRKHKALYSHWLCGTFFFSYIVFFFFPLIYFMWSDTGCDVFCVFEFEVLAPNLFLHYNSKAKVWLHLKGQLHYIQI